MTTNKNLLLSLILLAALVLRLYPLNFPSFTSDEARIAFRGYTLSENAIDELGRKFPLIFNSLEDYQLPLVSYITAAGLWIFGKSDFGARITFILIGVALVSLTYKISQKFSKDEKMSLFSALLVVFSPTLIFLSRFPNEWIVLTLLFTLLFYLLTSSKVNLIVILIIVILSLATSKIAWFIITPFVVYTLIFFKNYLSKKKKIIFSFLCFLFSVLILIVFLQIPQSSRSLSENNFPIFQDVTIKNGIDRLRGQGIESDWPNVLERLLFNKAHFISVGFFHWMSHLQPSIFFSQFDSRELYGFVSLGAWPKILIVPFLTGLILIIRKNDSKFKLLLGYSLILTFPLLFIYPKYLPAVTIFLPFFSLVLALGLININKWLRNLIIVVMILEVLMNFIYLSAEIKNTNNLRPFWIKKIVNDGYDLSLKQNVAFSDDITDDIVPFLYWYTSLEIENDFSKIEYPYRFRQTKVSNIKIIGSEDNFYNCGLDKPTSIFVSNRDLNKIQKELKVVTAEKMYKNDLGNDIAYLLPSTICVR